MQKRLEILLLKGGSFLDSTDSGVLNYKPSPEKWSKKEILGHLIDSAINNIKRFTEIQFEQKPFRIHRYNQDELIKANNYQNADIKQLAELWLAINKHILYLIKLQTEQTLSYEIILDDGRKYDLNYLIEDYISHLEHHLNQIMDL